MCTQGQLNRISSSLENCPVSLTMPLAKVVGCCCHIRQYTIISPSSLKQMPVNQNMLSFWESLQRQGEVSYHFPSSSTKLNASINRDETINKAPYPFRKRFRYYWFVATDHGWIYLTKEQSWGTWTFSLHLSEQFLEQTVDKPVTWYVICWCRLTTPATTMITH